MKIDFRRNVPPGYNYKWELGFWCGGMVCAWLYSLGFFVRLLAYLDLLYGWNNAGQRVLLIGAVMTDYSEVLDNALFGFVILAVCMVFLAVMHYLYHRQGSKSIYVMKRLPSAFEMHRRCLTLPALGASLSLLSAFFLMLIYFAIYVGATPEECLRPGQWYELWRWIL